MKVTLLGAGNMGGAIARGLVGGGFDVADLTLVTRSGRVAPEVEALGADVTQDAIAAVSEADVVIVAVKPWLVEELLTDLVQHFKPGATVISVAANVSLWELSGWCDDTTFKLVRAMPNTAVALGCGVTALASESTDGLAVAKELFAPLGMVVEVSEGQLAAVTSLSGCGIAYALKFLRAGQLAAVRMGLPAAQGQEIFAQVMRGAAALLDKPGAHAECEIDRVCTPGGLTIQGLNALEAKGFTDSVIEGFLAAYRSE